MNNLAFDDKDVVSMQEVLAAQENLEIEAATTAGQFCTYSRGYYVSPLDETLNNGIDQPIYSCRTCAHRIGKPVGVCEPCMLQCHMDHDVIECGIKRLFRCDCNSIHQSSTNDNNNSTVSSSTPLLPLHSCCAQPPIVPTEGLPRTVTNHYTNRTFDGTYCSCQSSYKSTEDTMLQCTICDEWYHVEHLPGDYYNPSLVTDASLICANCVTNKPYLNVFTDIVSNDTCSSYDQPSTVTTTMMNRDTVRTMITPSSTPHVSTTTVNETPISQVTETDMVNEHYEIQPWYVCLTCSKGTDDGTGVCYACAQHCHKGHVLSKPRISEFYCDCEELLQKQAIVHDSSSSGGSSTLCKLPKRTMIDPIPLLWESEGTSMKTSTQITVTHSPRASSSTVGSDNITKVNNDNSSRSLSSTSTVSETSVVASSSSHTESVLATEPLVGQKRIRTFDENSEHTPKHGKIESSSLSAVTPFASGISSSSSSRYFFPGKYLRYGEAPLWCVRTGKRYPVSPTIITNTASALSSSSSIPQPFQGSTSPKICMILNEDIQECLVPYLCHCHDCLRLYIKDKIISWFLTDKPHVPYSSPDTPHHPTENDTTTHVNNIRTVIAPDCRVWMNDDEEEDQHPNTRSTPSRLPTVPVPTIRTTTTASTTSTSTIPTDNPATTVSSSSSASTTVVRPPGFRTLYEQGMDALTKLPLIQLANTTIAYANMKEKLLQKLSSISQEGRVVTEQDIRQFFEELKNERK